MLVHQLIQRDDGTLSVTIPKSINDTFKPIKSCSHTLENTEGRVVLPVFKHEDICRIDAKISFAKGTRQFGIILNHNPETDQGYQYSFYPDKNIIEFDHVSTLINNNGLTRPVSFDNIINITIIIDKDICTAYINNDVALTSRMCNKQGDCISLFVSDGKADFTDVSICNLKNE